MPSVNVLLPLYNPNPDYLKQQLESINNQTYNDISVLVYNDNPDDATREPFVRSIMTNYPITYWHGTRNLGYIKAFEFLLTQAHADYIALCDQDDVWEPERVQRAVDAFEHFDATMVTCNRSIIDASGNMVDPNYRASHPSTREVTWNTGDDITVQAATSCYAIGMGTMYRTAIAQGLLPIPEHTAHDLWLALGASELGICVYLTEPLVQYRRHGNNASGLFSGVTSKQDWYDTRVLSCQETAREFCHRFPSSKHADTIMNFADARTRKDIVRLFKLRNISPLVAYFEILLHLTPNFIFSSLVTFLKN